MSSSREHTHLDVNGITLHVVQQGPADGGLVILLHGFPEYWYGWRKQMDALAEQGYRVWAPDQRGYNRSDKPEAVSAYRVDRLAADIAGLIRVSGRDKAIVVGHDWGGIVAWNVGRRYPELVDRLVILNAPHEAAMGRYTVKHPLQLFRSSYAGFFQLRGVPEQALGAGGYKPLWRMLKGSSRPGTFTEEDLVHYEEAWSQPEALRSMINWYRANVRTLFAPEPPYRVPVPVLVIWGARDPFLGRELALRSLAFCDAGRVVYFENATHWVHLEEAQRVNALLIDFFMDSQFLAGQLASWE
ncbi:alpha/beta hydrolase [Sporosarcina sp. NCCP-2716]|uniref:alpha/beta fold hydrolase n=1 Tax=Sporosarcina sp. NCCP-2716 TaxID=2943679 RepID=UPI00203C8B6D|nr:alpha/beta hydrolase [Sporosarcina sp. NCCP-2716]GKV70523.1 alpha/beta hydrolase [Sporosarcina sp. NCCP-2716]